MHTWFKGDLIDLDFARYTVNSSRPSLIFHLAGYAFGQRELRHVQPTYHNNLTATVNMLLASTEVGVQRLILAGTMEEPGEGETEPSPMSPYAASKWAGTVYARMFHKLYETPVCVARIFMVYGPGQDLNKVIPYLIRSLLLGKNPELTSGERSIDWIFLDDVVEGLIQMGLADNIEGMVIDLGSGRTYTIREIADNIKSRMGSPLRIKYGEIPDRDFGRSSVANLEETSRYIRWKPEILLGEGLDKTIEWVNSEIS